MMMRMMMMTIITITIMTTTRCYIKSSLTGPMIEFPGTESGPKPCTTTTTTKDKTGIQSFLFRVIQALLCGKKGTRGPKT